MTVASSTPLTYSVRHADPEWVADTTQVQAHQWRATEDFIEFVDSSDRVMLAVPRDRVIYIRLGNNDGEG